jgi:acyl-CoA thioester hydrolase
MTQTRPNHRPLLVELPIVVKTYDIDFANIVHNRVYIRWLEDLRQQVLTEYYPMEVMLADGASPILTRTEIDYRWPVRFGDSVLGRMWVSDLSRVRWTVEAEITTGNNATAEHLTAGERLAATGRQSGYFASLETLQPIRIPEVLRSRWQAAAIIESEINGFS